MKTLKLLALLAAIAVGGAFTAQAQEKDPTGPAKFAGKVTAVSASSITVSSKAGGEKTFAVNNSTKVKKGDGSDGAITDVASGSRVVVLPGTTPDVAKVIRVKDGAEKNQKTPEAQQ